MAPRSSVQWRCLSKWRSSRTPVSLWDEIQDPLIKIWRDLDKGYVEMPNGSRFDLHPMIGCIGVAPAEDGDFASITPTNAAGNIDIRYLGAGSTLIVPVFNDGALLSAAD